MQTRATHYAMRLDVAAVTRIVAEHFPQVQEGPGQIIIEELAESRSQVRLTADPGMLRPGGTVSGPTMFKLADFTIYAALLGHLGEAAIEAVTTSLTMNFLSRPEPGDLVAQARLIKVGRRLAVADIEIFSDGRADMVAHASGTYALPPTLASR